MASTSLINKQRMAVTRAAEARLLAELHRPVRITRDPETGWCLASRGQFILAEEESVAALHHDNLRRTEEHITVALALLGQLHGQMTVTSLFSRTAAKLGGKPGNKFWVAYHALLRANIIKFTFGLGLGRVEAVGEV